MTDMILAPRGGELGPIDHENLSSRAYRQLRQALLEGRFSPGQRLRISALAKMLGTSSTPVREALFRLASEQAVEIKAATSIYVPLNSARRVAEVMAIRFHLEGEAAAAAARRITEKQLLELEALQEEFSAAAAHDPEQTSVLNRQFHFRLLEISEMPILASIVENLWVTTGPLMRLFHTRIPKRDLASRNHHHFDILAALAAHDAEAARKAMQADMSWGMIMIDWAREMESASAEAVAS
jgi:DNA-binding GntR family transcriptional regulator